MAWPVHGNGTHALKANLATIRLPHAEQDAHQRGLASSVFAKQGMNLSSEEIEVHMLQGLNAGEAF